MSSVDPLAALNEKMDTLIKIQAALAVRGMATQREKIVFLYGAGLGPSSIANLLGTTPKTVSVAMAKHKKAASAKEDVNGSVSQTIYDAKKKGARATPNG